MHACVRARVRVCVCMHIGVWGPMGGCGDVCTCVGLYVQVLYVCGGVYVCWGFGSFG
jgi:hypothetical protein